MSLKKQDLKLNLGDWGDLTLGPPEKCHINLENCWRAQPCQNAPSGFMVPLTLPGFLSAQGMQASSSQQLPPSALNPKLRVH